MKIRLEEKIMVGQGPAFEESGWGEFHFPFAYLLDGGRIAVSLHMHDDSCTEYGKDRKWFVSPDGGASWEGAPVSVNEECGIRLPNGDRLFALEEPPIFMNTADAPRAIPSIYKLPGAGPEYSKDGKMPPPAAAAYLACWPVEMRAYLYDTLPEGLVKKAWPFLRVKKGETKAVKEYADIVWDRYYIHGRIAPEKPEQMCLVPRWAWGELRVAPDGAVWLPYYTGGMPNINPGNGAIIPTCLAMYFKSEDNGKSFKLVSFLEHVRDSSKEPELSAGFLEPDITFMPDGSMITLLRTVECEATDSPGWGPSYIARSVDNGKTWSKPKRFDDIGIIPRLCSLKCGVTLAAYGRPGIYVRKTEDPKGLKWDKPIEIMTRKDRSVLANPLPEHSELWQPKRPNFWNWAGSCCNQYLLALNDNEAMLFYTDFYHPDSTGKKRKTLFAQKIIVE